MKFPLADRLAPVLIDRLVVIDAGARDADPAAVWGSLPVTVYGFDPDADEVDRLNAASSGNERYFPMALWSVSGVRSFYDNNAPGGGSFLKQNRAITDAWKFANIAGGRTLARDYFFPTEKRPTVTASLGDWAAREGVASVDLLKLNIQGGELEVLTGAGALLDSALAVFCEVAFVESYVGRPLFSDIDVFLRGKGFAFFDLQRLHPIGRAASPFTAAWAPGAPCKGQLVEAHALYLRQPPLHAVKMAIIAEVFGQIEYAFAVIADLAKADDRVAAARCEAAGDYCEGETVGAPLVAALADLGPAYRMHHLTG